MIHKFSFAGQTNIMIPITNSCRFEAKIINDQQKHIKHEYLYFILEIEDSENGDLEEIG